MMTLADVEKKEAELLEKVQALFANPHRTQKEMNDLHDEIRAFEKEKGRLLLNEIYDIKGEQNG